MEKITKNNVTLTNRSPKKPGLYLYSRKTELSNGRVNYSRLNTVEVTKEFDLIGPNGVIGKKSWLDSRNTLKKDYKDLFFSTITVDELIGGIYGQAYT